MRSPAVLGLLVICVLSVSTIAPATYGQPPTQSKPSKLRDLKQGPVITSWDETGAAKSINYLLGGPGGGDGRGDFEDGAGQPSWDDWTSVDRTADNHWQIDTYNCQNLDPSTVPNHAWWCGASYSSCDPSDPDGGYGNNYNASLDWWGQAPDQLLHTIINIECMLNYDLEPGYDYLHLEYETINGWTTLASWTGTQQEVLFIETFSCGPGEYINSDQIHLRWRVVTDSAYSDEDCLWAGAGAAQIDNIAVFFNTILQGHVEGCESGEMGAAWQPATYAVGDYAVIQAGLDEIDVCRVNPTPQVCFADPGYAGTTWTYGPGGGIVNPEGGLAGPDFRIYNEIWSPIIELSGADTGALLEFDIYRHLEADLASPLMAPLWGMRATDSADPLDLMDVLWPPKYIMNPWEPGYRHITQVVSDLMPPGSTYVQIALGVIDLDVNGIYGTDGTPAPYFDNVAFGTFPANGPLISAREEHMAQDNFPEIGTIDYANPSANLVRFDMALNIAPPSHMRNDPGDSIVVEVIASPGYSLYGPPLLQYTVSFNNDFLDRGTPETNGYIEGYPNGVPDRYAFDLDGVESLYPGDVVHYYFEAVDGSGSSTLPADLTGYGSFDSTRYDPVFVMRALPSISDAQSEMQPEILFWYDASDLAGADEWFTAFANLGLRLGQDIDLYWTKAPSLGAGNGLGGRVGQGSDIGGYTTILYTCGAETWYTLSDGDFDRDAGIDIQVLDQFLEIGSRNLFITGDNCASDLMTSSPGQNFLYERLGVTSVDADVAPLISGQTAPVIAPIFGNPVFTSFSDDPAAYGICPDRHNFDAVVVDGGSERLAEFLAPGGDAGQYAYAAATLSHDPVTDANVVSLPYGFQWIHSSAKIDAPNAIRTDLLSQVLAYFNQSGNPGEVSGVPDLDQSMATWANGVPEACSVYTLPDGTGDRLDNCSLFGGSRTDATLLLELRDYTGSPVQGYPSADLWLETETGGLLTCTTGAIADSSTDDFGRTTFSGQVFGGGASIPGSFTRPMVNGVELSSAYFAMTFNSPDIDGDLVVDLDDVALFALDYLGSYEYRSDFFWNGEIDEQDVLMMREGWGARCPESSATELLPVSAQLRLGVFFDEEATTYCLGQIAPFTPTPAYLCLVCPQGTEGVMAWECSLDLSDNAELLSAVPRGQFLNLWDSTDHYCIGLETPLTGPDVVVLMDLTIMPLGADPVEIRLGSPKQPSTVPALPTFVSTDGTHFSVWPRNGSYSAPVAVINGDYVTPSNLEFVMRTSSTDSRVVEISGDAFDVDMIPMDWEVAGPLPDWLTVLPASGAITAPGSPDSLLVEIDTSGLLSGLQYLHDLPIEINVGFSLVETVRVQVDVFDPPWSDVTPIDLVDSTRFGHGAAWGDYDDDGDPDLYLSNISWANKLFRNDGGDLVDITPALLADAYNSYSYSGAWGDCDGDGDLDLFLVNSGQADKLFRNEGGGVFSDATVSPLGNAESGRSAAWLDYDGDGDLDLYLVISAASNILYKNDGTGHFTDNTVAPLNSVNADGQSAWADYDNDDDLDVYLLSSGGANRLYRNDGGDLFTDVTAAPLDFAGLSVSAPWGDYDNDGDLDIYLANFGYANQLFRNDGNDVFVDVTSGPLGDTGSARDATWVDYDNDGDLDIYVVNYNNEPNHLFRNDGNDVFIDATYGPLGDAGCGNSAPWADYDLDGDMDLYLVNHGQGNRLICNGNTNGNHWLKVDLQGTTSNTSGYGAKVRAVVGGASFVHHVGCGAGSTSQNSLTCEFGLGTATVVDTLQVFWPSGTVQDSLAVAVDQKLLITEPCVVGVPDAPIPVTFKLHPNYPNPFNPTTTIKFAVPRAGHVRLNVYDLAGRLQRTLFDADLPAEEHAVIWDGRDSTGRIVSSGTYFYRLTAEGYSETRRMVLVK